MVLLIPDHQNKITKKNCRCPSILRIHFKQDVTRKFVYIISKIIIFSQYEFLIVRFHRLLSLEWNQGTVKYSKSPPLDVSLLDNLLLKLKANKYIYNNTAAK